MCDVFRYLLLAFVCVMVELLLLLDLFSPGDVFQLFQLLLVFVGCFAGSEVHG